MTITAERTDSSAAARRAMIDSQLRVSGVTDDFIVAAMGSLAREQFLPDEAKACAYIDRAIPLANGQSMPAPLVQGLLLREAAPQSSDNALLVSCGSGYLAALLGPLVGALDTVTAAEAIGKKRKGGYSLVVIEGAIEHVPERLISEMAEGGRIVCGLAESGVTRIAIGRKVGGTLALAARTDIGIPVMAEFAAPKSWSF
jgi:protein-L-isoaspartate(D-aspartate) O-methyltransferase